MWFVVYTQLRVLDSCYFHNKVSLVGFLKRFNYLLHKIDFWFSRLWVVQQIGEIPWAQSTHAHFDFIHKKKIKLVSSFFVSFQLLYNADDFTFVSLNLSIGWSYFHIYRYTLQNKKFRLSMRRLLDSVCCMLRQIQDFCNLINLLFTFYQPLNERIFHKDFLFSFRFLSNLKLFRTIKLSSFGINTQLQRKYVIPWIK